jgi:hypothetical protein
MTAGDKELFAAKRSELMRPPEPRSAARNRNARERPLLRSAANPRRQRGRILHVRPPHSAHPAFSASAKLRREAALSAAGAEAEEIAVVEAKVAARVKTDGGVNETRAKVASLA